MDARVRVVDRLAEAKDQGRDEGPDRRPFAKDHGGQRDVATTVGHARHERVRDPDREKRPGQAGQEAAGYDSAVAQHIDVDAGSVGGLRMLADGTEAET